MNIEMIKHGEVLYAIIIRKEYAPEKTEFFTENNHLQQVGFIVYKKNHSIQPHVHKMVERRILGTPEVLFVRQGKMVVHFFDTNKEYLFEKTLDQGDLILLIEGGHGFKMLEDTVLLEVKQGPYLGEQDKERFTHDTCK